MNRLMLLCGVAVLMVAGCAAFPTGAPDRVCDDPLMVPNHSATGVNNTGQYSITAVAQADNPGVFQVTLSGPTFKGFVVRSSTPGETNNGQFVSDPNASDYKTMNCNSNSDAAVTHTDNSFKDAVTLFWQDGNSGNFQLQATVVTDYENYVTMIVS